MTSLPRPVPKPFRLELDPHFQPCESRDGDELYPNGIFEFNITRLLGHIAASGRRDAELTALEHLPFAGTSVGLNERTISSADLSRPVVLAEIAPGRFNLIDGHHRVAKARRDGLPSVYAFRMRCPEHVGFLTSVRAYEAYVEYWNSKVDEAFGMRKRSARARVG